MNNIIIRHTREADYKRLLDIYEGAREFMRTHGNPTQWNTTWPTEEIVWEDIIESRSYACELDGKVVGVFMYIMGDDPDPCYHVIEDGSWLSNEPYGVMHRIASSGDISGIGDAAIAWALKQCPHFRMDTHANNSFMLNLMERNNMQRRGIIYVHEDNDPRIAYEIIVK